MVKLSSKMAKQLNQEELARMANPLQAIAEQATPLYDRLADIVWWSGIESDPIEQFVRAMPELRVRPSKKQGEKMIFFKKIPLDIRRRIYSFVFEYPANGKHVNLSKDFATKDVFPPDFFITPWDLLHQIEGALSSCFQMRDEVYTYFWNTYHFHVTFSPYSLGPTFSGNSIKLLNAYAFRVNHLTVEVDLTKLAFSLAKDAKLLKESNTKLQKTLLNLVIALGRRRSRGNTMASLALLARRYQGFRPTTEEAPEEKVPYCPDSALRVFDCFCELRPLVLQCRMSGFSIPYTRQLLREILIKPFLTKPRPAPIVPAWPHYTPALPKVAHLSSFNTTANADATASGNSSSNESNTGSSEMPGFCPIIPSFGYSQANSSAGSLVTASNTGFYQLHENPQAAALNQESGLTGSTPTTGYSNPSSVGVPNLTWASSNSQRIGANSTKKDSSPVPNNTPRSMIVPLGDSLMTDEVGIATIHENTPLPSSQARKSSFGSPRVIKALETSIPIPARGTARSFTSRHGYIIDNSGSPVSEENNSRKFGLDIAVNTYKSSSFADEVNAEMNLRSHRAALPPRKDSLPHVTRSPSTIDQLNEMNEKDPAFSRAVEGLRMASGHKEADDGDDNNAKDDGKAGEASGSSKKVKNKEKKKKKKGRKHWF